MKRVLLDVMTGSMTPRPKKRESERRIGRVHHVETISISVVQGSCQLNNKACIALIAVLDLSSARLQFSNGPMQSRNLSCMDLSWSLEPQSPISNFLYTWRLDSECLMGV